MKRQTAGLAMLICSLPGGTTMLVIHKPASALVVWLLGGLLALVLVMADTLRRHSQK